MAGKKANKKMWEFRPFESRVKNPGRYCRISKDMQESQAWQELSPFAVNVYLMLKTKYNFSNANNLSLTYKEGMRNMSQKRFTKSLDELIDHGFIYLVEHNCNTRACNIYGLSDQWQYWGMENFKIHSRPKRDPKSTKRLKAMKQCP